MKYFITFLMIPHLLFGVSKVAVIGDSITNGFGVNPGESFIDILNERYLSENKNILVLNRSFNGATTRDGNNIVINLIINEKPDFIVVFLGLNDTGRRIPKEELKNNFIDIVEKSTNNCKKVILAGVDCLNEQYNQILAEIYEFLVEVYHVHPVLLLNYEVLNSNPGGHPSKKGHKIMADILYKTFEECNIK